MKFNLRLVAIALIGMAAVLVFTNGTYDKYVAVGLGALCAYIYWTFEKEQLRITNPYKLLEYWRKQPGGTILPQWTSCKPQDKQIEPYGKHIMYIFSGVSVRKCFALNTDISGEETGYSRVYSFDTNKLSISDCRRETIEYVFGKNEKKSIDEMVETLEKKGATVTWGRKNRNLDYNANPDVR